MVGLREFEGYARYAHNTIMHARSSTSNAWARLQWPTQVWARLQCGPGFHCTQVHVHEALYMYMYMQAYIYARVIVIFAHVRMHDLDSCSVELNNVQMTGMHVHNNYSCRSTQD